MANRNEIESGKLFEMLDKWIDIRQSNRLYFRGEKCLINDNCDYLLQPTLVRKKILRLLEKKWTIKGHDPLLNLEKDLLKRYKRYTAHLIEADGEFAGRTLNDLEILCLAQHYGLPTLMLDWTLNPFVALYFALTREDTGDMAEWGGKLWVMELRPRNKRDHLTIHLEDNLPFKKIKKIVSDAKTENQSLIVVPLVFTKRIAAQEGRFIYSPQAEDSDFSLTNLKEKKQPWGNLKCYKIVDKEKSRRDLLDKIEFIGFHSGRIFPDLSGWAKYLRQGYK